jgi:fructose 1,6-bisphosphatase
MLDHVFAKGVVRRVARYVRRLGRFEPHVVPAQVLKVSATHLAETLRLHGRASSAFASQEAGRERGERLGFSGH